MFFADRNFERPDLNALAAEFDAGACSSQQNLAIELLDHRFWQDQPQLG